MPTTAFSSRYARPLAGYTRLRTTVVFWVVQPAGRPIIAVGDR
jgi:hypothetical protein